MSLSAYQGQTQGNTQEKEVLFHPELLQKFDINGPRYTSYPSADRFHNEFSEQDYLGALKRVASINEPLSLYFHLPFCPNICYYCGCNKIVTKRREKAATYLAYLKREIEMQGKLFAGANHVEQLHFGATGLAIERPEGEDVGPPALGLPDGGRGVRVEGAQVGGTGSHRQAREDEEGDRPHGSGTSVRGSFRVFQNTRKLPCRTRTWGWPDAPAVAASSDSRQVAPASSLR